MRISARSVRILLLASIARVFDEAPPHFIGIPAAGTPDARFNHGIDANVRRAACGSNGIAELVGIGSRSPADQLAHDRFAYGAHISASASRR